MADKLIEVRKHGESIMIHPLALEDHKHLGWHEVFEASPVTVVTKAVKAALTSGKPTGGKGKGKETPPAKPTESTEVEE